MAIRACRSGYVAEAFRLAWPASYTGARLVVVLTAYLDASSSRRALTVSGYVSENSRWTAFEQKWNDSLSIYNLRFFHMTEFAAKKRDYDSDDWRHKGAHRLRRLLGIINGAVLASVSITIPLDLYRFSLSCEEKARSGNPYCLAAFGCFREITRWMRNHRPVDDEVAYVYDRGDQGRGEVLKIFNAVYDDSALRREHRLLSLRFEDKQRFVPLQAADILAWELNREALKQIGLDDRPQREEIALLRQTPWCYWGFPDDVQLRRLAGFFASINLRGPGWDTVNPIGIFDEDDDGATT